MKFSKTPIALAAITMMAGAPLAAHAVTVGFRAPSSGTTLNNVTWNNTSACEVSGTGIVRAQFVLINSAGNTINLNTDTSSPFRCNLVSSSYPNGNYTLRVFAYDSAGSRAVSSRSLTIKNSTSSTTDAKPAVSFSAPANNATVGALTTCRVNASDDKGIKQVQFFMDDTLIGTDTSSSYTCSLDNKKYTNGAHTLKAVVTDSANQTAETQITVNITGGIGTSTGGTGGTLPTVAFTAPAAGVPLKGNVQGPPNCTVVGSNITSVKFYINDVLTNTDGNASNGFGCWIDTTKYKDGAYTLKAVASNATGQTATATHAVTIQNGTTTPTANTPPILSITAPAAGSTLSGSSVAYSATASDAGGSVAKVELFLVSGTTQKLVATDTTSPYSGSFSTVGVANGAATLMAVATDNLGAKSTVQRSVTINNTVVSNPGTGGSTGGTGSIDPAHIVMRASADTSWASQSGFSAQAMGGSKSMSSMPEPGITGGTLSNGETLRLGKVTDPANGSRKVLQFQVDPSDPTTSGGKRAELSQSPSIEMNKVYWMAVSTYVKDWGTLSDADAALFGMQMHSGDNSRSLSPSFGIYTSNGGRSFKVAARWSTSSDPQQGNSQKVYYGDQPMQFGRWVDFVIKFKHNTSGSGYLQVWMDGQQIVNHQGNLGFNTPGFKDYGKFGYYNWSGSSMSSTRKVLLSSPTIVADPTGSTYSADQIRALVNGSGGASLAGSTSTTGGTTQTADAGVCSTASCVLNQ